MSLSMNDLDYVIELAHLDIAFQDKETYLGQLQTILGHMDNLNRMDLSGLQPTCYGEIEAPFYREDVVVSHSDLSLETNAPRWEDGCFHVPKMGE